MYASHDIIATKKDGPQSTQKGMAIQTEKRKRGKKVDTPLAPPNVTTNDAVSTSIVTDVDNVFSFSQEVSVVI